MWRGTLQAAASLQFLLPGPAEREGPGPAHGGFLVESAPAHPGLIASAFGWTSAADHRRQMERARTFVPLIGIVRDSGSGRVTAARGGRGRIDYRIGGEDIGSARRALVEMARLSRAAGALEVIALGTPGASFGGDGMNSFDAGPTRSPRSWDSFLEALAGFDFSPNRGFLFSAHQMGSARAGADPRSSACDPWGRVRRDTRGAIVGGLYVADASLFPSASGVNPMVTVMTLARRVARTVLAEG
jgi:choline dehydrogenase-like flavoprotein